MSCFSQLKELHKLGANLTTQDSHGRTLLHHAVDVGSKEIVRYIIDNGESASVDCQASLYHHTYQYNFINFISRFARKANVYTITI